MLGSFLFPLIFKEFKKSYPDINIVLIEEGTLTIQEKLKKGDIDVGIISVNDALDNLETIPIMAGEIQVSLSLDHELAGLDKIPFDMLSHESFVLLSEDTYIRQQVLQKCLQHDFTPNITLSSSQIHTIVSLVEQGSGLSFMLNKIISKYPKIIGKSLTEPMQIQAALAWNRTPTRQMPPRPSSALFRNSYGQLKDR